VSKLRLIGLMLALSSTAAFAAPNVTQVTQKGSLLIWPDIRVDGDWNTIVRIQNDGVQPVTLVCYWLDGNKNRVDFTITLTINQAIWFDAKFGQGSLGGNPFPQGAANGFNNPYLVTPGYPDEASDPGGPYQRGMLACWAVDREIRRQVKWNHVAGTATVFRPGSGAYEYNAYAFFVPTGGDQDPIGTPGILKLDGLEYDACPLYQIADFMPSRSTARVTGRRLALVSCMLDLNQDWLPLYTKLQFDAWTSDAVKLTGAFDCADSWHETAFGQDIDSGAQVFIGGRGRYRVQGVKSTQCPGSQAVGLLGVQSTQLSSGHRVGTTLTSAGKMAGRIVWDPAVAVPEGGIRD
jgi:hypothetical protein